MKIIGIGSDIIAINRVKKALKKSKSFTTKIFSANEIKYCNNKKNIYASYAKKFAAKEAFSKALGTGISKGISFKEVEILNNKSGKPYVALIGQSLSAVKKILKTKKFKVLISISDDNPFALAIAIIIK